MMEHPTVPAGIPCGEGVPDSDVDAEFSSKRVLLLKRMAYAGRRIPLHRFGCDDDVALDEAMERHEVEVVPSLTGPAVSLTKTGAGPADGDVRTHRDGGYVPIWSDRLMHLSSLLPGWSDLASGAAGLAALVSAFALPPDFGGVLATTSTMVAGFLLVSEGVSAVSDDDRGSSGCLRIVVGGAILLAMLASTSKG